MKPFALWVFAVLALFGVAVPGVESASVPPGFTDAVIASGITWPTTIAVADDGRVFVAEQGGALRVVKNNALLPQPFMVLAVKGQGGAANEAGLVGVALDPNFPNNRFIYVYYTTADSNSHNRVSRFTASASNPDVVQAGSEKIIFDVPAPGAGAHNSGALHFGPDGKLYVAVGDHSMSGNGQRLDTVKGKILRINPDGSIPSDNPFYVSNTGINRAIWAYGFRNPFRTAIQRTTGRLFANDVGNGSWEEINDIVAGGNYGWSTTEGPTTDPRFRTPFFAYPHQNGAFNGCAIVGGAFYNPVTVRFPSQYVGKYFFADYCEDWIRMLDLATKEVTVFASGIGGQGGTRPAVVDIQVGNDGALYYLERNNGLLKRVSYGAAFPVPPTITEHPSNANVAAGGVATFTVSAEGTPPLDYQWFRGTGELAGETGTALSFVAAASDDGATFKARVSNTVGVVMSTAATLSVFNGSPPVPTINPLPDSYAAGDTIPFTGSAVDGDGAPLPASALTWHVDLHHDTHTHPVVLTLSGAGGSFEVPVGEHRESANVFFRFHLTAKDTHGIEATTSADVVPRVATFRIDTLPTGLQIGVDGPGMVAPIALASVVGIEHTLIAAPFQSLGGQAYAFQAWDAGPGQSVTFLMPEAEVTFTATYVESAALTFYEDNFSSGYGPPWVTVRGAFSVEAGELRSDATFKKTLQYAIIPTFAAASQIVAADFARVGDSAPRSGLLLRVQDSLNYYLFTRMSGGTSRAQISKVVNGVETILADKKYTNAPKNAIWRMEAHADGNVLTMFLDDLFAVSVADNTFTSGAVGLGMGSTSGPTAQSQRADNFRAATP